MQKLLVQAMIYIASMSTLSDVGQRLMREYLFNRPITGAYEITANYLMVAAVFLATGYGYRQGAYIRYFLADRLPRKVKLVVNHLVHRLCGLGPCLSSPPSSRPSAFF
jgi:TRAP-type C4-dicarboxylate transport system permease small subunit